MAAVIDKDVHLTIEFVAFLKAGCYGQVQFHAALQQLQCNILPEGYIDGAHRALDKAEPWLEDASKGLPIFSVNWEAPETFDAISATNFMRELKKDLRILIPRVEEALASDDLTQDPDAAKLLVAAIVRSATTRHAFVESTYGVYERAGAMNLLARVAPELPAARDYLHVSQTILQTFSGVPSWPQGLCEKLRTEAMLTPGDFRAQMHDCNILLNVFAKEFTWELAEFRKNEAEEWQAYKIPPVAAGYWRAYNFAPEEFQEWERHGITGAPLAANWRRIGFEPVKAIKWLNEGFGPALAYVWDQAGFDPARAAAFAKRGIFDPARAPSKGFASADEEEEDQDSF